MDSASENVNSLATLVGSAVAEQLITAHVSHLVSLSNEASSASSTQHPSSELLAIGLAALDAFLQATVTGPVLPANESNHVEKLFVSAWNSSKSESHESAVALHQLRRACLRYFEVDGVVPYAHIPYLELFSLAKYILVDVLASETKDIFELPSAGGILTKRSLAWERLRVNVWHYKIITQPSLGSSSNFNKSSQWSDVPTLATQISNEIDSLRATILSTEVWATEETWTREEKALFLIEAANNYILLGRNDKAKEAIDEAAQATGIAYALSGALGKRTKFQENNLSQLVVFAKSAAEQDIEGAVSKKDDEQAKPDALKLNDDTLLEEIHYAKEPAKTTTAVETLPPALADLAPDDQPQLSALDEIILLTEATIKDAFSPVDGLTSEQIMPFAVRVLTDKSVNWQIYTQALLVRSRIEIHRSRTVERGVLQLQAVADQVLTDTTFSTPSKEAQENEESDVPAIQVTAPGQATAPVNDSKPTTFLPAATNSESAPAHVRLRYIHALSTPPRWHLESELAYAWAGVGSMTSALEIFKRLKLWAEVALCYASSAAAEDEDGRGSGGEAKAKGIIRWRLFNKTGAAADSTSEPEDEVVGQDVGFLKAEDFSGPERQPPPPNAARLWCILGDLENDPAHYERAWEISKQRFARAQRSLGEYYLGQKDLAKALEAYKKATNVNRLSPDMWGRLGDISLRLGRFEDAAEAYSRSISSANDTEGGEGARTWSNLGSALYSLYCELTAPGKDKEESKSTNGTVNDDDEDNFTEAAEEKIISRDPNKLLAQSLAAYKKGASIAHDNWRIWDNVVTLASRIYPTPITDIVIAISNTIRIRKSETALDIDILSALLQDAILSKDKAPASSGIYEPARGSVERAVIRLIEEQITPLITTRSELWTLVSRLRAWRNDYAGAIDASERAWRAAVGSSGSGLLPGESASVDWTSDEAAWTEVVKRTDELVSVLENWGPDVETIGQKWKGKARSAVRSVMGRGKATWEDSQGWRTLENLMEGLKIDRN
ncbi:tetratricopeptide repeat domain-containing protein [Trichoderma breve]|uniref:Tetratricopeptide repeat domain-containing protein n=1 Tax=Trichoderma breve TaxID=2034170 RepID=A0A9W9BFZ3_9HYPO|nr:tetratricopeptide repeat domain-containing protein [Trichoderma breve]KAJ4859183.1 tetratricopeptide repeat domain-containing protein [Trichoderma breve]